MSTEHSLLTLDQSLKNENHIKISQKKPKHQYRTIHISMHYMKIIKAYQHMTKKSKNHKKIENQFKRCKNITKVPNHQDTTIHINIDALKTLNIHKSIRNRVTHEERIKRSQKYRKSIQRIHKYHISTQTSILNYSYQQENKEMFLEKLQSYQPE